MTPLSEKQIHKLSKFPLKPLPPTPQPRTNRFTGITHTLEPQAVVLYDFIVNAIGIAKPSDLIPRHVTYNGTTTTKQNWDRARYLFLELWPNEYMDLID
jgi:hypothetical protein